MTSHLSEILVNPVNVLGPGIFLVWLFASATLFLWLDRRSVLVLDREARKYGLRHSIHQTVWSGKRPDYFDMDLYLGKPDNIDAVVEWFDQVVEKLRLEGIAIDRLAFIEKTEGPVGALTLKDLLSWRTRIPAVTLRLRRRGPAFKIKAVDNPVYEGVSSSQQDGNEKAKGVFYSHNHEEKILLISDVVTTGTTIKNAAKMVEDERGKIVAVAALYDREEDEKEIGSIRLITMTTASRLDRVMS